MTFAHPQRSLMHIKLEPGMHVADLGSGSGHFAIEAARLVGGAGKVYAVEVRKELVDRIKKEASSLHLSNVEAVWGDIEEPSGSGLEDEGVHVAILSNVLFQTDDKEDVLREAFRIIRPGGRLLFIDWSESFGGLGPHPGHVFSKEDAQMMAKSVGFEIEENVKAGEHHYGFIARKAK